ncbi:glycoside hydrolase family 97 catalytic domain-containing protein [Pedobacter sp. GR22-6]|uniref:glycoside hydrolase family 97 catalytic domain-containing protein n=1 Tax=Pedobacter sp. GR22-6 TaxID=3127957 RepID=UPI00307FB67A
MRYLFIVLLFFLTSVCSYAKKNYSISSPDGKLTVSVSLDKNISYSLSHQNEVVLAPSSLYVDILDGKDFGLNSTLKKASTQLVDQIIASPFYKRKQIRDHYRELTMEFKEGFNLIFRVYNEGMAYRFVSTGSKDFVVQHEEASFNFQNDHLSYVPYVKSKTTDFEAQYFNSFENTYTHGSLSQLSKDKLAFSPLVVDLGQGKKVCIAESDLENYPGMYLINKEGKTSLKSQFAPYPVSTEQGGHNKLQQLVTSRAPYIAKGRAGMKFPWRIVIVSTEDKQLSDNDLVYKLAAPSRIKDNSWIKPGKVAWEWWNHWGLSGVDFVAGVNNETYMAYIDFASKNGIEYIILDEGWAVNLQADLFQVVPEIDLKKLIAYGKSKNVGIILWAGYYAFDRDLERVCKHYAELGVKGFKIDFMDRDDQQMVAFHYRAAEIAAKYKLMVDFHGTYKPTGLNRTYPNVINYEAVNGMEQMKWTGPEMDMVTYDVTMPFIRMVAGPIDYTQGAMRNATKRTHRGINDEPMSQGTRCRQLGEYIVFESPLNMLCDNPVNYAKEQECTDFIAQVPTVWDNTVAVDGQMGKFVVMARQKGDIWYVGGLSNWDKRTLELDLSFLGAGSFEAEIFKDGINADRIASDYKKEIITLPASKKLSLSMAQGGGFAMRIYKSSAENLKAVVDRALQFSAQQYLLLAKKYADQEGQLPRSFEKGKDISSDSRWWCSGFFPGALWYLYENNKNPELLNYAKMYTDRVEREKYTIDNHDVGFMLYCSFGNGLRLTGDPRYKDVLLTGARSLATRYRPEVGLIRSWDHNQKVWQYPVIIDNIMNLELLLWAAKNSGDEKFMKMALSHADKTMQNHFRKDYSSYHVVSYDTLTAVPHLKQTHQGYSNESAWSRGQGWGLYGYTYLYRETGDKRYLDQAIHIANFIIHHPQMPKDFIPYWDFDAPKTSSTPRDASAASIIASALIELSGFVDAGLAKEYMKVAEIQLRTLASPAYTATLGDNGNFILKHSTGAFPLKSEVDVPLSYADYYYLEALTRLKKSLTPK